MTYGNGNTCKKGIEEERETYLQLKLIKKYRAGGRYVLLVLRLQKKRRQKEGNKSTSIWGKP